MRALPAAGTVVEPVAGIVVEAEGAQVGGGKY